MDLQTLKYFCTIAKERTFLRAARKLDYAQSNLSVRIQQLEKEMGVELFIRNSSGVSLTEKGAVLLRYAEKILSLADEAKCAVQDTSVVRDNLRIGSLESSAVSFLPRLLSKFHAANPNVKVSVSTGNSKVLTQKLLKNELEGAFIAGPSEHPELLNIPVRKETLVLLTDLSLKSMETRELLRQPLIVFPYGCSYRQILENWLIDENIISNQIVELSSLGSILASISAGLGIGLLPKTAIQAFTASQALASHEVPEPYRTVEIKFIYRKSQWNDVILNSVIGIIQHGGYENEVGQ